MPAVEVLDDAQPAPVMERAGKFGEPGPHAVCYPVGGPDSNLRLALYGVRPAVGSYYPHTEDAPDRLVPHRGAVLLGILTGSPGGHQPDAGLAVGEECRGQLADGLHVERTRGAAARVGDDAGIGIDRADLGIPAPPKLEETLLFPEDVRPSSRILWVVCARQFAAGRGPEKLATMGAEALAVTRPAVDEDTIDTISGHDLAVHAGHEVEVIRP